MGSKSNVSIFNVIAESEGFSLVPNNKGGWSLHYKEGVYYFSRQYKDKLYFRCKRTFLSSINGERKQVRCAARFVFNNLKKKVESENAYHSCSAPCDVNGETPIVRYKAVKVNLSDDDDDYEDPFPNDLDEPDEEEQQNFKHEEVNTDDYVEYATDASEISETDKKKDITKPQKITKSRQRAKKKVNSLRSVLYSRSPPEAIEAAMPEIQLEQENLALRRLEIEHQFELKKLELEKDERLALERMKLEIEMEERIKKYEIDLKYNKK